MGIEKILAKLGCNSELFFWGQNGIPALLSHRPEVVFQARRTNDQEPSPFRAYPVAVGYVCWNGDGLPWVKVGFHFIGRKSV